MKISPEFQNNAGALLALTPTFAATAASAYFIGPLALITTVGFAALTYSIRNSLAHNSDHNSNPVQIEPDERIHQIAKNIGLEKTPPVFVADNVRSIGSAVYTNVVLRRGMLEKHSMKDRDFLIAHEMMHIKRKDGLTNKAGRHSATYNLLNVAASMGALIFFGNDLPIDKFNLMYSVFSHTAAAGCSTAFSNITSLGKKSNHRMEFDCDEGAALATKDIDAAIDFWEKRLSGNRVVDNWDSQSHPSDLARANRLHVLKAELGL